MSWNASLAMTPCPTCGSIGDERWSWNYTHNTNWMISAALEGVDVQFENHFLVGPCWWGALHEKSAASGAVYLATIVERLRADPAKFRAMNPSNGCGDYDRLLVVLQNMRDASVAAGTRGVWRVTG